MYSRELPKVSDVAVFPLADPAKVVPVAEYALVSKPSR
jgi:hypothetical protein